ncbi:MAG: amidophosphoribosyltransferase [Planctomycetaceae bacterium]|nr:amidophosphoribosyltransferase [Planctomycetaceae bacterium]
MKSLREECGIAAVYCFVNHSVQDAETPFPFGHPNETSRLIPRMLLDLQNRGQSAAGMTTFSKDREEVLMTHKEIGTVTEVFRLSHRPKFHSMMDKLSGNAAIGHVRYATNNQNAVRYAQPMDRYHFRKHKWFSFAFNGQMANYHELMAKLAQDETVHISQQTDAEILLHEISYTLSVQKAPDLLDVFRQIAQKADGAYSLVMLNAQGDLVVVRDPKGIKPLCYACQGRMFAAASESVALFNLGFSADSIKEVEPGTMIHVSEKGLRFERFAESDGTAHCFFEWAYFANVASTLDGHSVYMARKRLGEELARQETVAIQPDSIVVPVPDTSKAAADGMAYALGIPCLEGLIRNRYSGRTFIEGGEYRKRKAETKYTPLTEVLEGKRIFLVEDSIVRSTTMRVLIERIRKVGLAKEIHVRVACPPIIAPCFYGVDMSHFDEIYATNFCHRLNPLAPNTGGTLEMVQRLSLTQEMLASMAADFGADSVQYLTKEAASRAIGLPLDRLCTACATAVYPTPCGTASCLSAYSNFLKKLTKRE